MGLIAPESGHGQENIGWTARLCTFARVHFGRLWVKCSQSIAVGTGKISATFGQWRHQELKFWGGGCSSSLSLPFLLSLPHPMSCPVPPIFPSPSLLHIPFLSLPYPRLPVPSHPPFPIPFPSPSLPRSGPLNPARGSGGAL